MYIDSNNVISNISKFKHYVISISLMQLLILILIMLSQISISLNIDVICENGKKYSHFC